MTCQRRGSERVLQFNAKCSDLFWQELDDREHDGYVPDGPLGGGDYVCGGVCLDCGQLQGQFPVSEEDAFNV